MEATENLPLGSSEIHRGHLVVGYSPNAEVRHPKLQVFA
jgi:hypothetical protein